MTELIAVATLALLFVVYGLFVRVRHGCSGPGTCGSSDGRSACGECPRNPSDTEVTHA